MYIIDRFLHRILKEETPKVEFACVKPKVSHFYVFGCPIYIHVPQDKRNKLESSTIQGISIGYSETWKYFKIYILAQQSLVVR